MALLLAAIVVLLTLGNPTSEFWWPDSPRHAMGGAVVYDYVLQGELQNPVEFAQKYYIRYPAFAAGFYPPGFYLFEGLVFSLFGVSPAAALASVGVFYFVGAAAVFFLMRFWVGWLEALAAGVLFIATPEIALWGREVMLDIPMCSFLLVGVYLFIRFLDDPNPDLVYWSALPLIGAIYIKYNAAFIGPPLAAILLWRRGLSELARGRVWMWCVGMAVLLLPAIQLMLTYGAFNLTQATEVGPGQGARLEIDTVENWIYYLQALPQQAGWESVVLAAVGLVAWATGRRWWKPARNFHVLVGWFWFGYLVFTLIALKESRHTIVLTIPVVLTAALTVHSALSARWAPIVLMAWAAARYGIAVTQQTPTVEGYVQVADQVAEATPQGGVIMFFGTGRGTGEIAFRLRSQFDDQGLTLFRGDKMLFNQRANVSTMEELEIDPEKLARLISELGIRYVIYESAPFLESKPNTALLKQVLASDQFERVSDHAVLGSAAYDDNVLTVYRNLSPLPKRRRLIEYNIPLAGISIKENE